MKELKGRQRGRCRKEDKGRVRHREERHWNREDVEIKGEQEVTRQRGEKSRRDSWENDKE